MRVYFAPCGIGLGHVGRCLPIAGKFLEKNAKILFSTYGEGIDYVENEDFPLAKAPPIGFQVKPDGTVDFRRTAINPGPYLSTFTLLRQVDSEVRTIEEFKPDVVVSDSRVSPLLASRILGIPRVCILNQFQVIIPRRRRFLRLAKFADTITLTLVGKMWTSGNTVLIPDFPPPYTVCAGNLNIPKPYWKNVKLIGPILPVHPSKLPTKEELHKKLGLACGKPVIFAPISGPIKERAFLTVVLKRILSDFPEDYEIVISLGNPNVGDKLTKHGNVRIYDWLPNRFEYLKACDLVIGRAGHGTLTQCLCYGKPMILIPTPSHTEQLWNANQANGLGIAKIILQEQLSKQTLLASVKQVLEENILERLKEAQEEALRHDGLENAVNAITETAER